MDNILMVTPYVPYPPVSGGRSRTYNLVRRLARYFSMTVVCFGRSEEQQFDLTPMRDLCELIVVDRAPSPTTRQAAWLSLTSPRPITMRLYSSPQMRETIENLLKTQKFDLIHVESFYTVQNLPQDLPVPLLLSEPAIEYLAWWRHSLVAQPVYQRPGIALEALKMRIVEPQVWTQATLVGVMSEFDEQIIRQATPGVPTTLAPNGVDIDYFQPDGSPREGASALFLGDFKYFPNTDAVQFFIQEIMPLIRAERPDFTLTLLGKDSPPEIVALGKDPASGIYVEGLVEDTRPYLSRATMFICPLRSGSGTRFKLLESLACECPVVSTSIGCEGLDPTNGRHMLVADTPRSFADAVLKLINNPEEAARLGHHGRTWVVERHSWERSAALVGDAYMRLIGSDDKTIPGRVRSVPVRRPRASG